MMKSDLHPPHAGLSADPVLYGVAAALAELFPPVPARDARVDDEDGQADGDGRGDDD